MKTIVWHLAALVICLSTCAVYGQEPASPKPADEPAKPAEAPVKPAAPAAVSEAEAKKAEELFEDGRKLFFQSKYAEAAAKLAQAADGNPAKTAYKLLLAKAYRLAGENDKGAKVFEEILKANPEHVEAGIELAELLSTQKQPDRVISVLEPLLKFKHDYPLYHLLAEAHYAKEQFEKARGYFEEAVKLNPKSGNDHYQLANIYLSQKRFAKAGHSYETAGSLGISSAVYHFKLASVYFNLHNYLGTVSVAEIIGGQPGEIKNNWFLLDPVPGEKDKFHVSGPKSAVYQAAKARELGIDIFELRFLEANIWLNARRYANADAIYKELSEKVKKEDAGLFWSSWAQAALGMGEFDNYLARLDKAIAAEPEIYKSTLSDALVTVAQRYQQRGENAKYLEYLGKAVSTNPLSARLHLTLGDAFWAGNEKEKAIEQYKLVLELEPDHAQRVRLLNRIRGQEEVAG